MREGVWTHGVDTSFEAWVGDKSRLVIVTRGAIEEYLRLEPEQAAAMTPDQRRDFVNDNLELVIAAANRKTISSDKGDAVTILAGEL